MQLFAIVWNYAVSSPGIMLPAPRWSLTPVSFAFRLDKTTNREDQ